MLRFWLPQLQWSAAPSAYRAYSPWGTRRVCHEFLPLCDNQLVTSTWSIPGRVQRKKRNQDKIFEDIWRYLKGKNIQSKSHALRSLSCTEYRAETRWCSPCRGEIGRSSQRNFFLTLPSTFVDKYMMPKSWVDGTPAAKKCVSQYPALIIVIEALQAEWHYMYHALWTTCTMLFTWSSKVNYPKVLSYCHDLHRAKHAFPWARDLHCRGNGLQKK